MRAFFLTLVGLTLVTAQVFADCKLQSEFEGSQGDGKIWVVAFVDGGRKVVTGAENGTVSMWNALTGQMITSRKAHASLVSSIVFNRDRSKMLTISQRGPSVLWDTNSFSVLAQFGDSYDSFKMGIIDDAHDKVYLAGNPASVFTISSGERGLIGGSTNSALSPDSQVIASASGHTKGLLTLTGIWDDSKDKKIEFSWRKPSADKETYVAFSPDGTKIVASASTEAYVYDVVQGKFTSFLWSEAIFNESVFSADSNKILTSAPDGAYLWTADGVLKRRFSASWNPDVNWHYDQAEFMRNDSLIFASFANNETFIWETDTGNKVCKLEGINSDASGDGKSLVSVSREISGRKVRVWTVN